MLDVIVTGSYNQDLVFRTASFPAPGETRLGRFATGPGGKGFNQAVAARRLDAQTLFIGATGSDTFATGATQFAERHRLRCCLERVADSATGTACIMVDDAAENMIVVAAGANELLSVAHIERQAHEFNACRVVLTQLECNLDASRRALELGRERGATTMLNPAPILDNFDTDLLRHVDVLIPNETEFAWLLQQCFAEEVAGGLADASGDELHALCRRTAVPIVIVTLGSRGAFVSLGPDAPRHPATLPFYFVEAASVAPVDTTGAGDAFCGALAAGIARHGLRQINVACLLASRVAGLSTERPGAAEAMPDLYEVERRFGA